jgi:hypothetical protein
MGNRSGEPPKQEASGQPERSTSKRPYMKPAFRYERVFETMALACGKISTTQEQCRTLLKLS